MGITTPADSGPARPRWTRLASVCPYRTMIFVLGLGLVIAPFIYLQQDVIECWLVWGRASGGARPWDIYRTGANYPAFIPYVVTLSERARLLLGAPEIGALSIILVKLPNLLAHLAGAVVCLVGLRPLLGLRQARAAAVLYALCPALFINAALWGQWDGLQALSILVAVAALLHGRPAWAGAALGWALAIKFQAVVAVPVLGVYVWRRYGTRGLGSAVAAGGLTLGLLSLPMVLGGGARGMLASYTGAVDFYTKLSDNAFNIWYLVDRFNVRVLQIPSEVAFTDARPVLGPITPKHIGLTAFAAYTAFLLVALWRRPTGYMLVLVSAMSVFAFFMLPTQMHERYVVPAVALLIPIALVSPRAWVLFAGLSVTASLNQLIVLVRCLHWPMWYWDAPGPGVTSLLSGWQMVAMVVAPLLALTNVALFIWATRMLWRETFARKAEEAAPPPPRGLVVGVSPPRASLPKNLAEL